MARVVALLTDPAKGVIRDAAEIHGVGHRVVSFAAKPTATPSASPPGQGHHPRILPAEPAAQSPQPHGHRGGRGILPRRPAGGRLRHRLPPDHAPQGLLYATPYEWYEKYRLRRYGFHGTSHKFIAQETAEFLGKPLDQTNLISLHLGNGCSMAAIRNGQCVDTTMGVTPLEGLMMGTRSGDIDPAAIPYIMEQTGRNAAQVVNALNKQSGLKGICGVNDMREVIEAAEPATPAPKLALEMFAYRIQKYIGAYMAVVPGLHAIVFTAGIGENSAPRARTRLPRTRPPRPPDRRAKNPRAPTSPAPSSRTAPRSRSWCCPPTRNSRSPSKPGRSLSAARADFIFSAPLFSPDVGGGGSKEQNPAAVRNRIAPPAQWAAPSDGDYGSICNRK
jgi:hypothetical protein